MQTRERSPLAIDRAALAGRYRANRRRSSALFDIPIPEAYVDRPVPLRLPIAFYEGHLPALSCNTLLRRALGQPGINPFYEQIFERGIDPEDAGSAKPRVAPPAWPDRDAVRAYGNLVDQAVLEALASEDLSGARSPLLDRGEAAYTILEHEEMHHETLLYITHRLPFERKRSRAQSAPHSAERPSGERVVVAKGSATLGVARDAIPFGWDNEFGASRHEVGAFEIDADSVTNGDWLEFVRSGGPAAPFWRECDGGWELLGQFEALPLPLSWPVYVTWDQAAAYAGWRAARLPTEAEYHRAAFGTPWGEERAFPWGDAAPSAMHGNFGLRRFDPEPVGASPAGDSAWGVHDLIGNGWEWTSTVFGPLPGFEPMASYPQYSLDFFDGAHYVMKGASPATPATLVRRSFRNWFRSDYPYMYAKFRLVRR
jgi:iron(II)-dependent oxidoreductase